MIEAAHKAHKAALAAKAKLDAPLDEAERTIKGKLGTYQAEQDRKAREEQRQREEAARRAEEDARLAEALELEAAGDSTAAEEVIAAPVIPFIPPPPAMAPKVAGVVFRTVYAAEVTNLLELVQFVGTHPEFLNALLANNSFLNSCARSMRENYAIPGTRLVKSKGVAGGRA